MQVERSMTYPFQNGSVIKHVGQAVTLSGVRSSIKTIENYISMKNFLTPILLLIMMGSCGKKDQTPFVDGLDRYPMLKKVMEEEQKYKVQILYTRIDRNEHMIPMMENFSLNLDDNAYFYPASTVKLPVAVLALEWLEEQQIAGLTAETVMLTDSVRPAQIPARRDSSAEDSLPSIAHYIKKILLVSDNDAYNRLFELLGTDYINRKLQEKGLKNTVISQRLSFPVSKEENRHFNPVRFVDSLGKVILEIPARYADRDYVVADTPKLGKSHYVGDSLVEEGMDFTYKNKFALSDLSGVVQRILFPLAFPDSERFVLNEAHRKFILKYMGMYPNESDFPSYPLPEYYDSYAKFIKFGGATSAVPRQFRVFNKTGWSYGFLIDGGYLVDFDNGVEFLLAATIYVNEDEILNDNNYEYEEIGKPFFAELGEYIYRLELDRKKAVVPDLNEFRLH